MVPMSDTDNTQEPYRLDLGDPRFIDYGDRQAYLSSGDLRVPFHRYGIDDAHMGRSNSDIIEEVIRPALREKAPGLLARVDLDSEYSAVFFEADDPQDLKDLRAFIVGLANEDVSL